MVETYVATGAARPDVRVKRDVDVRELEVLAFIHKFRRAKPFQIERAVGLSPSIMSETLRALIDDGLVRSNGVSIDEYTLTFDGVALVRRRTDNT